MDDSYRTVMTDGDLAAALLAAAYADGSLSDAAKDALLLTGNVSAEIERTIGDHCSTGGEILLVTFLIDDSGSIGSRRSDVISGYNRIVEALRLDERAQSALCATRFLSGRLLGPYAPIDQSPLLDASSYPLASSGTPLFREAVLTLGAVLTKTRQLEASGATVRTFTLVITDGEDNASAPIGANHVRAILTDMLDFATNHVIAGMGIGNPHLFQEVFASMGIPPTWRLTPDADPRILDKLFTAIARALLIATRSPDAFTQLVSGPDA